MIGSSTSSRAIHRRLLLSGAFIVMVVLAASAVVAFVSIGMVSELNRQAAAGFELRGATDDLRTAIADQETAAFDYAVAHEPSSLQDVQDARARELNAYDRLGSEGVSPSIAASVADVRELAAAWRSGWIEPFLAGVGTGETGMVGARDAKETYDAPLMAELGNLSTLVDQEDAAALAIGRDAAPRMAAAIMPVVVLLLAVIGGTWLWVGRTVSAPLRRLNARAREVINGVDAPFVAERDDEIGELAEVLERLRREAAGRYLTARLEADRAAVFNQLAELISFAQDEETLVNAAIRTLQRVAPSPRGDVMLVNNSTNRLIVAAGWGENPPGAGPAPIDRIDRCPGIRRANAYVAADLADEMSVRCPAHRATSGSVACVPMPALGTIVGVMHLERPEAGSFEAEAISVIARVAEQVALAIANARLMHTMEGLAMSDPLTGLNNPRFFDGYLEQELAEAERDHAPTTLLMLDIDHFKVFNDTHGHPAGDEALRTFARVLRSTIRSSDVLARYGGEEFVVAMHRTSADDGRMVAEKIRAAVEQAVVEIGPGRYARMTVSVGLATGEPGRVDPKGLMALADAALYRAKEGGRNRVECALADEPGLARAAARRLGRAGGAEAVTPIKRRRSPRRPGGEELRAS